MKKVYQFFVLVLLFVAAGYSSILAQCSYNNVMYPGGSFAAPANVGGSIGNGITLYPGEGYSVNNLLAGNTYRISTCGGDPGFDTRLTIYPQGGGAPLAFNDDYCGLLSRIDYTPTVNGSIDVLLDMTGPGGTCVHSDEVGAEVIVTLISTASNQYCTPQYSQGTGRGDFINGVSLGTINNQTTGSAGGPTFTFYSSLSTNLLPATGYTLSVTNNPDFNERVAAWIDYNQDLEFSEDERLGQVTVFPGATGNINFTTPANVIGGPTRLRVRMVFTIPFGSFVEPCGLAEYGETEDYIVTFPTDPSGPTDPDGLDHSTACGLNITVPDNACPNGAQASITVSGLSNLGEENSLESVRIIIEHPMAADLDIYLESPTGQLIELSTDNGGSGANYGQPGGDCSEATVFSISATTPITAGTAPFVGTFLAEGNLNAFNTGTNPNGIWRLRVCDDFAGHAGTIRYFGITFSEEEEPQPPSCPLTYSLEDGAVDVAIDGSFSWTPGTGAPTSYTVYFGTDENPPLYAGDYEQTSLQHTGEDALLPSTTYYYRIVPVNNVGAAEGCPVRSFTTAAELLPPSCASNYSPADEATGVGTGTALLWDAAEGEPAGYNVYFGTNPGDLELVSEEQAGTLYQPEFALAYNTQYYYQVVPVNAAGPADGCPVISFTTEDEPVVQPGILMQDGTITACDTLFYDSGGPNADYSSGEQYVLTITPSEPGKLVSVTFTSFVAEASSLDGLAILSGADINATLLATLTGTVSGPVTYTSDAPGGELTFVFNSDDFVNAAGWIASLSCVDVPEAPACAVSQSPADEAANVALSPTFSWASGGGVPTGYDVYLGTDPGNLALVAENIPGTTYSPEGPLDEETTYYWLVTPRNEGGVATGCDTLSFTTVGDTPPDIIITNGSVTTCSGNFYDSGGPTGNYGGFELHTFTIFPSTPGSFVRVDFSMFSLTILFDALQIYNGSSATGDPIGTYGGNDSPGVITSTANDGALTFRFATLAGGSPGWAATISCVTPDTPPSCAQNYSPADEATDVDIATGLSWEAGPGAAPTGYTVYFGTDPGNLAEVAANQPGTLFDPGDLNENTTYYWQVVPSNDNGAATDCPVLSFTTGEVPTESPSCAQNYSPADESTDVDVETGLSWEAGPGAAPTGYTVYFGTDPGNLAEVAANQPGTSFDPGALNENTTYYWQVVPSNGNGAAQQCPVLSFTTGEEEEPSDDIIITDGSVTACSGNFYDTGGPDGDYDNNEFITFTIFPSTSGSAVRVNFSEFDLSAEFLETDGLIIINGSDALTGEVIGIYAGTDSPGEVTSTADDGALTFIFTSNGSSTASGWAATISCVTPPAAPGCAQDYFPADTIVGTDVELSWAAGPGEAPTGYTVFFGTDPDNLAEVATNQGATSFAPENLAAGTTYYWQVVPSNDNGSAADCPVNSFATEAEAPVCVINRLPVDGSFGVSTSVTLSWEAGSAAVTGYNVYLGTRRDTLTLVSENQSGTTYEASGLQESSYYYWQVVALNGELEATECAVDSFATDGDLAGCVTNYIAPPNGAVDVASPVTLVWSPGSGVTLSYKVYLGTDPGNLAHVATVSDTISTHFVAPLTTYYWHIIPVNAIGETECTGTPPSFTTAAPPLTCVVPESPANGATGVPLSVSELSWEPGPGAAPTVYDVYFGTDPDNLPLLSENQQDLFFETGFLDIGITYYWKIVPKNETDTLEECPAFSFTMIAPPGCANSLLPADESTGVTVEGASLSWDTTEFATSYDVYFGLNAEELELVAEDTEAFSHELPVLEYGTTYYWQIVPKNETGSAQDCPVLSFTTEDEPNEELVIFNGELTTCSDTLYDTGGSQNPYDLEEEITLTIYPETPGSFVQLDILSFNVEEDFDFLYIYNGNEAVGLPAHTLTGEITGLPSIISAATDGSLTLVFSSDDLIAEDGFAIAISCHVPQEAPGCASDYSPADGAVDQPVATTLTWSPGEGSPTGYDVYFGTDPDNLQLVSENQPTASYDPDLVAEVTYYWQVVPRNANGAAEGCPVNSFIVSDIVNIIMHTGTVTTCNANFYDSGGANGNYGNSELHTLTICPSEENSAVSVTFTLFNVEGRPALPSSPWDYLRIFNGTGTGGQAFISPLSGNDKFSSTVIPGPFASSAEDGCLTFEFSSDGSDVRPGWEAVISCVEKGVVPGCATNQLPADQATGVSANYTVLSWTAPSGIVAGYDVYFGTDPGNLERVSDDQPGTTYNPGVLTPGTVYYWQVIPFNASGEAEDCQVFSFIPAQDILMTNGTINTCEANFYDSGGPNTNYSNDQNLTFTICPNEEDRAIRVVFSSFNVEENIFDATDPFDFLSVFNGADVNAPPFINPNSGNEKFANVFIPGPFTSTDASGCLTFRFLSDNSFTRPGWVAKVSCLSTDIPPDCAVITGPVDGATDVCLNEAITWQAGDGAVTTGYDVYVDSGEGLQLVSDNQPGNSYSPGLLEPNTVYSFVIVPRNINGPAEGCDTISFTTGTCLEYCDAVSIGNCFEHISRVTFGEIDNSSECGLVNGYSNYTAISTNVYIGSEAEITIINGNPFPTDSLGVWIDWNQDGVFSTDEFIQVNGIPMGPYTARIIPPADAVTGPTRIRIRVLDTDPLFGDVVTPCGPIFFGETEDYTVIVNEPLACPYPNNIEVSEVSINSAVLTWETVDGALEYLVRYRQAGEPETVSTWVNPVIAEAPFNLSFIEGLEICAEYIVQVGTQCEGEGEPVYSFSKTFLTNCMECSSEHTAEAENCGDDANGGCLSDPAAFQPISCGETICGSSFFDGDTRDTDWYSFTVTEQTAYEINVLAEFTGSVFVIDVANCDSIEIVAAGPDFQANTAYTLQADLPPGSYAVFVAPSFDEPAFACGSRSLYTVNLTTLVSITSTLDAVCTSGASINLAATPAGGIWSGNGVSPEGVFNPANAELGPNTLVYAACGGQDTLIITVADPSAPQQPEGPGTLCSNPDNTTYTVAPITGVDSYVWVLTPTEAGTIAGTGTSATVTWNVAFSGFASIVVATQSACGLSPFSVSRNVTVTSAPATPAAIEGPATSCTANQNYFSPGSPDDQLTWSLSPQSAGTLTPSGNTVAVQWAPGFTGNVVLSVTASNDCGTSSPATLSVTVVEAPDVDFVGLAASYCTSDEPAVLTGIPVGGYFVISGGVGITGNVFNPSQVTAGQYSITYYNQVGGCQGSITQQVQVIAGPSVTITPVNALCSGDAAVTLSGTPSGGTFSGNGVSGNSFNPGAVAPGAVTISYTVTDPQSSCSGVATTQVTVNPAPVVTIIPVTTSVCVSGGPVTLTGVPAPGVFSGTGVSGNTFNPSVAGIGSHVVTYTVNNGTCTGTDQATITVTAAPSLAFSQVPATTCTNAGVVVLASNPAGATFSGPGVSGNLFNPATAGVGVHTLNATLNQGGCTATATHTITVNRSPIAGFNVAAPGYQVTIVNTSLYADTYEWSFGDGNTSTAANPSHTYASNGFYTIRLIASNAACGADTFSLNVDISVGIGSIEGVDMLQVFPNPTRGAVNLVFNSTVHQSFDIRIMDATGRLVQQEALTNYAGSFSKVYDLSDKAKGMYFFTITSEKGSMNFKVVRD